MRRKERKKKRNEKDNFYFMLLLFCLFEQKTRFDDIQSNFRYNDQQLRQVRLNNEQLNQELLTTRRQAEQQLLTLNNKSQDSLKKITLELDRKLQRLNEYERFINVHKN